MSGELITGVIVIALTLLVFSRVFGDNPAFRAVQYLFVGSSLGYAFLVVYFQVLRPTVLSLLAGDNNMVFTSLRLVPFVLGVLLLPRILGRQSASWLANIPLALLFGVATAIAFGGALVGTLLPQIADTIILQDGPGGIASSLLVALVVILTLSSFFFTRSGKSNDRLLNGAARVGRWLLMITFGFFFAGAVTTYLVALNDRLNFIVSWFRALAGLAGGG